MAALVLSKVFRKKGMVSIHTIYKFKERRLLGKIVGAIFRRIDKILVLAPAGREDLVAIGIPADKIAIFTCWVENENKFVILPQEQCRAELGLPAREFLALFVGRFSIEKGLDMVLAGIKKLTDKNIHFLLVGNGPMFGEVSSSVANNGHVILCNSIDNHKLPYYFNAADVLIFGSVDQDYYGRVTMEALSCGLPVILPRKTKYFGREVEISVDFPDRKIGWLIDAKPDKLMECLLEISKNRPILSPMRQPCRDYAIAHFSKKNADVITSEY